MKNSKFPNPFSIQAKETESETMKRLHADIAVGKDIEGKARFYIMMPSEQAHCNHPVGKISVTAPKVQAMHAFRIGSWN